MSAKDQALLDIKEDLRKEGKTFINFITALNPVMRKITHDYLKTKRLPMRNKTQLVAHCFFMDGNINYNNYEEYYDRA